MITLLSKIFIVDREDYKSSKTRNAYGVLCGAVGIFFNILLFALKFFAGTITASVAITADAFNNLSDAGSSLVSLFGFKLAAAKPDKDHPFGHGRIEYIAGLVVAGIILIMGYELFKTSISKIIHPEPIDFSMLAIGILVISILVKLYMGFYNMSISKKINSATMKATAMDSISDTIATSVVLIATLVAHYTGLMIDGYCGLAVSFFILFAGYTAAKDTISPLLGQAPEQELVDEIERIALEPEIVLGMHDLVVHDYGPGRLMISLHAEVPASCDLLATHDVIDNIEHRLNDELNCHATIHLDPVETDNPEVDRLREIVKTIVNSYDCDLLMHDFRVVFGDTHTNILFDIVKPFELKISDGDLKKEIQEEIFSKIGPNYYLVLEIDKPYVNR